jgi:hypothetical protein
MAASNPQLMYSMPPQYQEPVQYQYYATEQPPPPPPPLSPYPSVYSQPPPPPLPYDHQSLVGGIKRSAEDGMFVSLPLSLRGSPVCVCVFPRIRFFLKFRLSVCLNVCPALFIHASKIRRR